MDLSFPSPTPDAAAALPEGEARSLVAALGLWATGAAAAADAAEAPPGTPVAGAFNPAMAARLIDWGQT